MIGFPKSGKSGPISSKVLRGLKRLDLKAAEDANKKAVRRRDKRCRFPLCGCKKFNLALHVSHAVHKGMGGDPTGERSQPELMVLVCSARHKENTVSIDRGTLRWAPITEDVANGPIQWWIDTTTAVTRGYRLDVVTSDGWALLAHEAAPGVLEPLTPAQKALLQRLAEMTT